MRTISLKCVIALASLVVAGTAPGPAHATPGACQRAIIKEYPKYAMKRVRVLQECEDLIVKGFFPVGSGCPSWWPDLGKIAAAEDQFRRHVRSACGGNNHVCNVSDTGADADETLASIGWDIGACPDFEGSGCTNAIADCSDIAECLVCITEAAQSQALTLYYDALNVPASDRALEKCQREIGKRSVEFLSRKLNELETCERKVLSGDLTEPCPDPATQLRIDRHELRMHRTICRACGGADRQCGGAADRTPTEIGFTPNCPDVTIPGGAACGGAIGTFSDIATCVECVTEFKVDCLDAVSVPGLRPYPAECNTVP